MGCFVYCLFGTSKDITLGPTAIMSLMTAAFAAAPEPKSGDPTIAILLSLICGVIQLFMGVLNLGESLCFYVLYTIFLQSINLY